MGDSQTINSDSDDWDIPETKHPRINPMYIVYKVVLFILISCGIASLYMHSIGYLSGFTFSGVIWYTSYRKIIWWFIFRWSDIVSIWRHNILKKSDDNTTS